MVANFQESLGPTSQAAECDDVVKVPGNSSIVVGRPCSYAPVTVSKSRHFAAAINGGFSIGPSHFICL